MYLDWCMCAQCIRVLYTRDFHLHVNQQNACSWLCTRKTCIFARGYSAREHQV